MTQNRYETSDEHSLTLKETVTHRVTYTKNAVVKQKEIVNQSKHWKCECGKTFTSKHNAVAHITEATGNTDNNPEHTENTDETSSIRELKEEYGE